MAIIIKSENAIIRDHPLFKGFLRKYGAYNWLSAVLCVGGTIYCPPESGETAYLKAAVMPVCFYWLTYFKHM